MKRLLLIAGVVLLAGTMCAEYLRYPAPSPDGSMIVFSARGNLWVVGRDGGAAKPITTHPAYDHRPVWSPDGTRIAFSSDRYGNDDIFILQADGTDLKRLTFNSADDLVCDWSSDNDQILFSSRRDFMWHWQPSLYEVPVRGGTPVQVLRDFGVFGTYVPGKQAITYTPRRNYYFTKGYQGGAAMDIYYFDREAGSHEKLTEWKGDDVHALWKPDRSGFYYLSDHDRVSNLWFYDLSSGATVQKTFLATGDITFPNISANGSVIAFEHEGGIKLYDTVRDEVTVLGVTIQEDTDRNPDVFQTFTSKATGFALGKEEKQIAFTVHGDLYAKRMLDTAATHSLTQTSFREKDPVFTKDESELIFVSNEKGNDDIYVMKSSDEKEPRLSYALKTSITPLTDHPEEEYGPRLSPDEKMILYVSGVGDLYIMDREGKETKKLVDGWNVKTCSWSPDSRYIAFSREDDDYNEDIYILPVKGGKPFNITRHPAYDTQPVWSPDGKYLAFLSNRVDYQYDVYYLWLTREEEEKTEEQRLDEEEQSKAAGKEEKPEKKNDKKNKEDDGDKKEESVKVSIDLEDLWYRVHRLTEFPGDETDLAVSRDSKRIAFVSSHENETDLYIIKRTGEDLKRLTRGNKKPRQLYFADKDAYLYFLAEGGSIQKVTPDGSKQETVSFSASTRISIPKLREEIFREGWRILNNQFYDPDFHGIDWAQALKTYLPMAKMTYARRDFDDVMGHMLGELNASHLGIYPPRDDNPYPVTGYLGIRLDPSFDGEGVKVLSVLPESPAGRAVDPLKPGDVIRTVDGVRLDSNINLYELLFGKSGKQVVLDVARDDEARIMGFKLVSLSEIRDLLYDDYVRKMRTYVDGISGGRLAYIHVRYMDKESYLRFQMELFSESYRKDGLIIDVRNNGGGWTTDLLLQILEPRQHAYTIPRGGGTGYPDIERKQVFTWRKPFIVLCNQDSFSNAEIFSHAVKTLNLAKVVGVETNGSVISTDGTQLLDGSWFRIPLRGWYVKGTNKNMEEYGAVPDYIVENPPEIWEKEGRDLQVARAVEILLEEE